MKNNKQGSTIDRPIENIETDAGSPRGSTGVLVYNNDTNTYQEVIDILMKATECDEEEAFIETWEIDHYGKAIVHYASREECERVARTISTIGIKTEVVEDV